MKHVSFTLAKIIEKAGYPLTYNENEYESPWGGYEVCVDYEHPILPAYLDVWLWLQRDKNMYLIPEMKNNKFRCRVRQKPDGKPYFPPEPLSVSAKDNMEDAIIVAIDFLINNDFIK